MIHDLSTKRLGLKLLTALFREYLPPVPCDVCLFHRSMCVGVLRDFNKLKGDTQSKNITAWTPVVSEILEGYCKFDSKDVSTSACSIAVLF